MTAILILSAALALNIAACKTEIQPLPISDEDAPVGRLENGNYEVTPGYVWKHIEMMKEIKRLKQIIDELRDPWENAKQ